MTPKAICLILVFVSACTGQKVQPFSYDLQEGILTRVTEVSTLTPVPTSSPTTTHTAIPKPTLTHTPTATFIPTPLPPVIFSEDLEYIEIEGFTGVWSPSSNVMVGIHLTDSVSGTVALASAPEFTTQDIEIQNTRFINTAFTWTPDGRSILFGGPTEIQQLIPVEEYSTLWIMDQDGSNPRRVDNQDTYPSRWLNFEGWFDNRNVIISEYTGGGSEYYAVLDYRTGRISIYAGNVVGNIFESNSFLIPGVLNGIPSVDQLFVLSKTRQNENTGWIISDYVHYFPQKDLQGDSRENNLMFKDWLPGSNQLLASWFSYEETSITAARMILWDVKTDKVTPLLPGGVDGSYSTNGDWLVVTSMDTPVDWNAPLELSLAPVSSERTSMVLVDANSAEILAKLPVVTLVDVQRYMFPVYKTYATFSPDDRYLAFLSPTVLDVDDTGWPVWSGESVSDGSIQLNIIDLEQKKLLFAVDAKTSSLLWAPSSKHLLFVGPSGFWELLDISTGAKRQVLSINDGYLFHVPEWSFDGQYIKFTYWTGEENTAPDSGFRKIYTWLVEVNEE